MASMALPPPLPQFSESSILSPPAMSAHVRKHSRNPTASQLPTFTFNPGSTEDNTENEPPVENTEDLRTTSRRASKPAPLPAFTFNPGADMPVEDRSSPTHPVLEEMVMNQQRMSRSARPAPLPAFTFAPGGSSQKTPSPTRSDFSETSLTRPVGGHKRAGSEFVGGGGVEGPTLMSTSPQKHESRPSGPPVTAGGRRGHAHRRSQAVSISDIDTSDLIKAHAVAKHRTGSAPATSTPTTTSSEAMPGSFHSQGSPQSRHSISGRSPPPSPRKHGSISGFRPRVEFADKIDVIPRPLSMISSETEGSYSTVRYSHSLSNSINSIASPTRAPSVVSSPTIDEEPRQRPKTADPVTLLMSTNFSPERSMSEVSLPKRPLSASGSPAITGSGSPPIKKKHFWFSHSPDRTPVTTPATEEVDPLANLPAFAPVHTNELTRPKTSPERSTSLRRRKYHTWTSGIFSKKTKQRASKSKIRRSPTPPALQRRVSDRVNQIFDADDTVVLRSEPSEAAPVRPNINALVTLPTASHSYDEISSPVLDLDAALCDLDDEEKSAAESRNRTSMSRIAKLHSSERRGNVDAFGAVHRRTESAPNMPAFNRGPFGLTRHGSNPSLAEEVFDEEEEDMFLAGQRKSLPISPVKREDVSSLSIHQKPSESGVTGGLGLSNVNNSSDAVIIVDTEEAMGADDLRSSKSTIEAPLFVDSDLPKRPLSSPMSFAFSGTPAHYASSTEGRTTTSTSMISSPDPEHIHFDNVPRLAPGFGQSSPDFYLRPSNDDLPSLSDSISSGAVARISSSANTRSSVDQKHDQRSASMFVPGTSRSNQSWKRSSLASLNRLIPGSANGSKLKFETTADLPLEEKSKKKTNRLSRLVSFWRLKDKSQE